MDTAVPVLEALYAGPRQQRSLLLLREIFGFLRANGQGNLLNAVPSLTIGGPPLDLIGLYGAMTKRGGVQRVQDQGLIEEVMAEMGHPYNRQTCYAITLHYKNYLYAYEQAAMFNRRIAPRQPSGGGGASPVGPVTSTRPQSQGGQSLQPPALGGGGGHSPVGIQS
ncbi:unnamed protein product, partial [Choristocarpus tenellus]